MDLESKFKPSVAKMETFGLGGLVRELWFGIKITSKIKIISQYEDNFKNKLKRTSINEDHLIK